MGKIKIAIIGAGSSYTPEIIEGLYNNREKIEVTELVLMDINEDRLRIMEGFCRRYIKHLGLDMKITSTLDRVEAIRDVDFIITQIRVGGNTQRILDEKIPLKYNVIGQETTGPGGFMKALRTIPVMLEIAKDVERWNPDAWIINYSNPTGLITEAVKKHSKAKIIGLCAGGIRPQIWAAEVLGVEQDSVRYDYLGLNHMSFSYNITIDGRKITKEEFEKLSSAINVVDSNLVKKFGLIPSQYTQYYFHTNKRLKGLHEQEKTRGEQVLEIEKEVFEAYADESVDYKPDSLAKRGGGGYSQVALGAIEAIHNNKDKWMVVNVPNNGTIKFLPDDAVIETACMVNKAGVKPLNIATISNKVWGIISAVKNYEQLTVQAAVSGDKDTALFALMAHPLVRDYDLASALLDELLEKNKDYLPSYWNI